MAAQLGVVLLGHGSLRSAAGAAMIRMAARLRELGVADCAEAGFLNFSRPSLSEAVARCVAQGATQITVQPYFLIPGKYVLEDLPAALAQEVARYPQVRFAAAQPFGAHPALIALALARLRAVDASLGAALPSALLLMAHGTPYPAANGPLYTSAAQLARQTHYQPVVVGFLECNEPAIAVVIDRLVAAGVARLVALPYFLQAGRHVRTDLPALIEAARLRHPGLDLALTHHLDYDLLLAEVIAQRVQESCGPTLPQVEP